MPELTSNLGLKKPLGNEIITRSAYNENLDLIDQNSATQSQVDAHLADTVLHLSIMTAQGDIIYRGASAPARLAKGTAGQLLAMNSGANAPEWVCPHAAIVEKTDSFTLALTEANAFIKCNKGTAMNCTVPPNSDVAFPTGTEIELFQYGAGAVTVVAASGVTIQSKDSNLVIDGQYAGAALKKIATDEWALVGALTA